MGPFSSITLGETRNKNPSTATIHSDMPGYIKEFYIREWSWLDYLQFKYSDHDGFGSGNSSGGSPHHVPVPVGSYAAGLWLHFAQNILCEIDVVFGNHSSSGRIGNRDSRSGASVEATVDDTYALVAGKFQEGGGPGSGNPGTLSISLVFRHESVAPRG